MLKTSPRYVVNFAKLKETDECKEPKVPDDKLYVDVEFWHIVNVSTEKGLIEKCERYNYIKIYFDSNRKRDESVIVKLLEKQIGTKENPKKKTYDKDYSGQPLEDKIYSTSYATKIKIGEYKRSQKQIQITLAKNGD